MKKLTLIMMLWFAAANIIAQKETFDLITYDLPAGWKKESKGDNYFLLSYPGDYGSEYCKIYLIQSIESKGSLDADFESAWQNLVVKRYNPSGEPQMTDVSEADGWKSIGGMATDNVFNSETYFMLNTMTGFGKVVNILAITDKTEHLGDIADLLNTVSLKKPSRKNKM